jgi:hypothetical protein
MKSCLGKWVKAIMAKKNQNYDMSRHVHFLHKRKDKPRLPGEITNSSQASSHLMNPHDAGKLF